MNNYLKRFWRRYFHQTSWGGRFVRIANHFVNHALGQPEPDVLQILPSYNHGTQRWSSEKKSRGRVRFGSLNEWALWWPSFFFQRRIFANKFIYIFYMKQMREMYFFSLALNDRRWLINNPPMIALTWISHDFPGRCLAVTFFFPLNFFFFCVRACEIWGSGGGVYFFSVLGIHFWGGMNQKKSDYLGPASVECLGPSLGGE